jgi:predicted transcriptional regulator
MYSSSMAKLINQTFNRLWPAFDNKDMWYKAFVTVLPKSKFKKIAYIKKNKEAKKANPERKQLIEYLAKNMEMSKREIKEILDNHDVDIAKCIKAIK